MSAQALLERPYLSEDYNPRWDPMFKGRVLIDLLEHAGQYRQLGRLYAPDCPSFERCTAVRDAVAYWRRHGFAIEGDRTGWASRGYRLITAYQLRGDELSLVVGLS